MEHYRQGDVLLVRVNGVPKNSRIQNDTVLAYGEATGHAHVLTADSSATQVQTFRDEDSQRLFASVMGGPATVTHQEHKPITVGPGIYEIIGQREYIPGAIRRVAD